MSNNESENYDFSGLPKLDLTAFSERTDHNADNQRLSRRAKIVLTLGALATVIIPLSRYSDERALKEQCFDCIPSQPVSPLEDPSFVPGFPTLPPLEKLSPNPDPGLVLPPYNHVNNSGNLQSA